MKISAGPVLLTLAVAAPMVSTMDRSKANEYKDTKCKKWNYGHNGFFLGDVTMDGTTNSVYINEGHTIGTGSSGFVEAWSKKTKNGGSCTGELLGHGPMFAGRPIRPVEQCVNINTFFPGRRINCLRFRGSG